MTLVEFKERAEEIAAEYGLTKHFVTVMAGYYGNHMSSNISYTAQVWCQEKRRHITSELNNNPETTLLRFKHELERQFKKYDETIKDIEI
jgi:hypothetical protein